MIWSNQIIWFVDCDFPLRILIRGWIACDCDDENGEQGDDDGDNDENGDDDGDDDGDDNVEDVFGEFCQSQ